MEKKKIYTYLLTAVLIALGYYLFTKYQTKQEAAFDEETQVSDFEDAIPSQCESGDWIEFPDYGQNGNFSAYQDNANLKAASGDEFTNQDGSVSYVTDAKYSLSYFAARDVRIEGIDLGVPDKKKIYVKRIKCVGEEANKDIQSQRRNLMTYINENIDTLAPEKSHGGAWQVQTFFFATPSDLYVEYESSGSIAGDSPYDARLWLIRATKMDTKVPALETLAYIEEDENDPDKNVVKTGEDIYKDAHDMSVYEFDTDKNSWVLQ